MSDAPETTTPEASPGAGDRTVVSTRSGFGATLTLVAVAGVMLVVVVGAMAGARRTLSGGDTNSPVPSATTPRGSESIEALKLEPLPVKKLARPPWSDHRREEPRFTRTFNEAIKPYVAGDYAAAVARMHELAVKFPAAPEPPLYGAVSELMLGHAQEASDLLTRAAPLITREVFAADILWYRALANRALGQTSMMDLRTLCAVGADHGPRACAAIREIESRQRAAADGRW